MRETRVLRGLPAPEIRAAADGGAILAGYAAVFDRYSQNLGGFVEVVRPGAFAKVLRRLDEQNTAGLGNHEPSWLLGTTDSETLRLEEDATGLRYEIDLDLLDPDAVRAQRKAETRKFRGSSFSFRVAVDGVEWSTTEQGFPLRSLTDFERLFDVGPVTFPAYLSTGDDDLAVALRSLAEETHHPIEELIAAAGRNELRSFLPGASPVTPASEVESNSMSVSVRRYARQPVGSS